MSVAENYLEHRFNLLGSGWVKVYHGMSCRGVEGYRFDLGSSVSVDPEGRWLEGRINTSNLSESKRIWQFVHPNYVPIDWHLDFKSGYRWSERIWFRDVTFGIQLGADIKVPWELGRMQHLTLLAWAYLLAKSESPHTTSCERYACEFRNQVLDFIVTNPPRFGVNWASAMECAIRAANWLLALDLFRICGARFDEGFEKEFSRSIYAHGLHITENLEWAPRLRGNHYLAQIVGLLFISTYLPRSPIVDAWLAFGVQELMAEIQFQFYPDGTNFEASTNYHTFSAELATYGIALVLGLPEDKQEALQSYDHNDWNGYPRLKPGPTKLYPLPETGCRSPLQRPCFEFLERAAEFVVHTTKPDGHIVQIGDNDSGRFFKIQPKYHELTVAQAKAKYLNLDGYQELGEHDLYFDEDLLDSRHVVAAINGLFNRGDFYTYSGRNRLEEMSVRSFSNETWITSYHGSNSEGRVDEITAPNSVGRTPLRKIISDLEESYPDSCRERYFPVDGPRLNRNLELYSYLYFGIYIFRSERIFMSVRCGTLGRKGSGGHAHNDQLAVELVIDGENLIVDPGTYLYTPLPHRRNEYRSVRAHFAPQINGKEPVRLDLGLFRLRDESKAKPLYFGPAGFAGVHYGYGFPIYRVVHIEDAGVRVIDYYGGQGISKPRVSRSRSLETNAEDKQMPISPGYGVICRGL